MTRELPSPDLLRKILRYEPESGMLFWMPRRIDTFNATSSRSAEHTAKLWNTRYAGTEAFTSPNTTGYKQGSVQGKLYMAHHVAWTIYHGYQADEEIDHIDGDRMNNRILNLRAASRSENQHNKRIYRNNTSEFKGVSWLARDNLWRARIGIDGKRKRLGDFATIEEAAEAYAKASAELHGEFSRLR